MDVNMPISNGIEAIKLVNTNFKGFYGSRRFEQRLPLKTPIRNAFLNLV
jgi:hypothetical protein